MLGIIGAKPNVVSDMCTSIKCCLYVHLQENVAVNNQRKNAVFKMCLTEYIISAHLYRSVSGRFIFYYSQSRIFFLSDLSSYFTYNMLLLNPDKSDAILLGTYSRNRTFK